jgi:hypothetical protein
MVSIADRAFDAADAAELEGGEPWSDDSIIGSVVAELDACLPWAPPRREGIGSAPGG